MNIYGKEMMLKDIRKHKGKGKCYPTICHEGPQEE
jgi:hypothetical protein